MHKRLSFASVGTSAVECDRDLTPVAAGYDPASAEASPQPSPGTVSAFGVGATEYRSVAALQKLPDYAEWVPAIQAEIDYAMRKTGPRPSSRQLVVDSQGSMRYCTW